MKKFKITKEQILEMANWGNSKDLEKVKQWFPDAFENKLEVGKWYKTKHSLYCVTEIDNDNVYAYGFDEDANWKKGIFNLRFSKNDIEATLTEISVALINEAKKIGFKENVKHTVTNGDDIIYSTFNENFIYDGFANKLLFNNFSIFKNGKWAEVIPLKITKEQIEEKLGYEIEIIELK